jgi:DNA replication protein DnaC
MLRLVPQGFCTQRFPNHMETQSSHACPDCRGTGWKAVEVDGARSVARCECFHKSRLDRLFQRANVPRRYESCSFEGFKTDGLKSFDVMSESLGRAKTIACRFVEEYPLVECGLLIMGPCGVGKTHLAVSILRALIYTRDVAGVFYDFRDLLKKIQGSYNSISQTSETQILDPVLNSEVLVLDDLGAERPTEWVRDTFAYILNSRYNRKLATVITTNFDDRRVEPSSFPDGTKVSTEETLEDRIGTRLRSRLYEMCKLISIEGSDYRKDVRQADYRF